MLTGQTVNAIMFSMNNATAMSNDGILWTVRTTPVRHVTRAVIATGLRSILARLDVAATVVPPGPEWSKVQRRRDSVCQHLTSLESRPCL